MTPARGVLLTAAVAMLLGGLALFWLLPGKDRADREPNPAQSGAVDPAAVSVTGSTSLPAAGSGRSKPAADIAGASSGSVTGRVVDSDGSGLAGVRVRIRTSRRSEYGFILRQDTSDRQGRFVLSDLDADATYVLFTEAFDNYPGYRLDGFTLDKLPTPFVIRLAGLELVDLRGTVVDTEHVPIANFTVTVDSIDSNVPPRTVTSNDSGAFVLERFPAGELKIYTAEPDYFRIQGLRASAQDYSNLTLVIDHGRYRLAGRVIDAGGAPIESARVTLNSEIRGNDYRSRANRTRLTDSAGRFEFNNLGGIKHTLGIYANGYQPRVEQYQFQSFADSLEIRL